METCKICYSQKGEIINMGGNIANDNARINLLMTPDLKEKIRYYSSKSNRSGNSVIVRILEDAIEKKELPESFSADPDQQTQVKTARMNLVVPKALKEKLSAEAKEKGRSLNNYICTKLMIFFEEIWPDSL